MPPLSRCGVNTETVGIGEDGGCCCGGGSGIDGGCCSGGGGSGIDGGVDGVDAGVPIALSSTITSRYHVDGATGNVWLPSRSVMYGASQTPVHGLALRPV